MNARFFYGLVLALLLLDSCVTPFQPDTVRRARSLVVEGLLTNQPGPHTVTLSYTADYTVGAANLRAEGAQVTITDEGGQAQALTEIDAGVYRTPVAYYGQVGRAYTLTIVTKDGSRYDSQPERMKPVPKIENVYWKYTEVPVAGTRTTDKGFDVYLDTRDSASPGDFYRWTWLHYDRINVCDIRSLPNANPAIPYSFLCCTPCWAIRRCENGNCLNIATDVNINGNAISGQFILRAPYDRTDRYYVEIEQLSLTRTAYQFLNQVDKLIKNTGGLFDIAPINVGGNMMNKRDPTDPVFGYFGVSAASVRVLEIDRSQVSSNPSLQPPLPPEPPFPPGPRYCVECAESPARTATKPRFWQD